MSTMYLRPKVNYKVPYALKLPRLFMALAICICFANQTFSQELVFRNDTLKSGTAGQVGATYKFPNVTSGVDAWLEIKGRSGSDVVLEDIDTEETGWTKALQPKLGVQGNILGIKNWWMEFELRFMKAGTNQSITINNFDITALDIDGDGLTISEYVEFYQTKTTLLESLTQLLTLQIGASNSGPGNATERDYRITGPILNFLNIDTAGTQVMSTSKYVSKSKIKFRLGGNAAGLGLSNAGVRFNSLWFRSFNYTAPRTLPVNLVSFNAAMVNKNVALTWTTSQEKNASHFTVERSTDGVEFTDAGIIFTEGNSENARSYNFKDPISTSGKGILYYRLKVVDMDGRFEYSQIRLIKLGDTRGKLELTTFPNPVVNELRITIPESWQNRQVVYEVYSGDGQLLKRFLNKSATQTEIINMQFYVPGTYIVKALNDKEIATQRVVKRK
jgi:hypothetical protein